MTGIATRTALSAEDLDQLFVHARTHNTFAPEPIPEATLRRLYELMKWGPTSMNCQPARLVFVTTPEGKEKLAPALSPGNLDKTLAAPATVIIATDSLFYEHLPTLFPAYDAKPMFAGNAELASSTAFHEDRNPAVPRRAARHAAGRRRARQGSDHRPAAARRRGDCRRSLRQRSRPSGRASGACDRHDRRRRAAP
jgi:nitroreductase